MTAMVQRKKGRGIFTEYSIRNISDYLILKAGLLSGSSVLSCRENFTPEKFTGIKCGCPFNTISQVSYENIFTRSQFS